MKKERIDNQHEGRDKYFVDVDRMINEGLAGGTVTENNDEAQIEEARPLQKEDPPNEVK